MGEGGGWRGIAQLPDGPGRLSAILLVGVVGR